MTYRSCWIEDPVSGSVPVVRLKSDCLPSPFEVADWATAAGLPLEYVDNCWVRMTATAFEIRRLLHGKLLSDPVLSGQLDALDNCQTYVLVSEEF